MKSYQIVAGKVNNIAIPTDSEIISIEEAGGTLNLSINESDNAKSEYRFVITSKGEIPAKVFSKVGSTERYDLFVRSDNIIKMSSADHEINEPVEPVEYKAIDVFEEIDTFEPDSESDIAK